MRLKTGRKIVEAPNEYTTSNGNIMNGVGPNFAAIELEEDFLRLEVGTRILVEEPTFNFDDIIIGVTPENKNIEFGHSYNYPTAVPFSFKSSHLSLRHKDMVSIEGSLIEKEILDAYFEEGEYTPVNPKAQSMCFINGKNTSSQSLTPGVETLVQWNDGLVWFNPLGEWKLSSDPVKPYHFVPQTNGLYMVWASFSLLATTSSVGDITKASISIPNPTLWHFIEVVHQRPDLDFVPTYRRNIDLQGMVYLNAGQPLGIYVTSASAVSNISNTYTMMLAIKKEMAYTL